MRAGCIRVKQRKRDRISEPVLGGSVVSADPRESFFYDDLPVVASMPVCVANGNRETRKLHPIRAIFKHGWALC